MIGRIVRPADFERVLAAPQRSRSAHFAIHHLSGEPQASRPPQVSTGDAPLIPVLSPELSTASAPSSGALVDESGASGPVMGLNGLSGHWLGLVVPKRHAKRAVTRNLIKRQARAAMVRHLATLPAGVWVVRLRAPFDRAQFISPASDTLREATHAEMETLFDRAIRQRLPADGGGRLRPRGKAAKA